MNKDILSITIISILTSILCVIAPISINIGYIPISLSLFMIYIIGALTKNIIGFISVLIYIFIGVLGLLVFANYSGGIGVLFGHSGGFIIGYLPCVLLISIITSFNKSNIYFYIFSMIIGTLICYIFGAIHFMIYNNIKLNESIAITIIPFIIIDIIKIFFATVVGYIMNNKTIFKQILEKL